jgi:hypothetical protein
MATIPASQIVYINPGVLAAGGNGLVLNGLMLTNSTRVPIGTVPSFPTAASVGAFFGLSSPEYAKAQSYFLGFDDSTKKPTALLFAQYPSSAVSAWLKSAPIIGIPLTTLQGLNQSLTVVFDGQPRTATVNLAGATSYSAVAALIQSALNGTQVSDATFTGAIATQNASFIGSIAGNTLSVSTVSSGSLAPGAAVTGAANGTTITSQISGTTGGAGTYIVSVPQQLAATALTATYGVLTVSAVASGTISTGQTVVASGVTNGTQITGLGTGTGLAGTYYVSPAQTVASGTLQTIATPITASFDSVTGSLVLYSGDVGASASAGYASGALATSLGLTQASGATLSQGADGAQPIAFMSSIVSVTQNWASFMTLFDPDGGNGSNAQKLAFAQWVNSTNKRYMYVCRDTDPQPALSNAASTSLGALIRAGNLSGTYLMWEPAGLNPVGGPWNHAAFITSIPASIDFDATNGRTTFDFKAQTGLYAAVTDVTTATNLKANGYNFYGAYGTANQTFVFNDDGEISGPFTRADTYVNQIWMNNGFQLSFMLLLTTLKSIPYNMQGYDLIRAAGQDVINRALNFGAIRAGVALSQLQKSALLTAAGKDISAALYQNGYYFQVLDADPQVRQARASPPCNFWYMDGGSVQRITLNSVAVL